MTNLYDSQPSLQQQPVIRFPWKLLGFIYLLVNVTNCNHWLIKLNFLFEL